MPKVYREGQSGHANMTVSPKMGFLSLNSLEQLHVSGSQYTMVWKVGWVKQACDPNYLGH